MECVHGSERARLKNTDGGGNDDRSKVDYIYIANVGEQALFGLAILLG